MGSDISKINNLPKYNGRFMVMGDLIYYGWLDLNKYGTIDLANQKIRTYAINPKLRKEDTLGVHIFYSRPDDLNDAFNMCKGKMGFREKILCFFMTGSVPQ